MAKWLRNKRIYYLACIIYSLLMPNLNNFVVPHPPRLCLVIERFYEMRSNEIDVKVQEAERLKLDKKYIYMVIKRLIP